MSTADAGLLALRLALGLVLTAHGVAKLTRRFGGVGLDATAAELRADGLQGGRCAAGFAGACQAIGGVATAVGLLLTVAAAALLAVMVVAASTLRHAGFWARGGGYEYALFLAVVAAGLVLTGPGDLSVDHALRLDDPPAGVRGVVAVGGVAVGLASFWALSSKRSQSDSDAAT